MKALSCSSSCATPEKCMCGCVDAHIKEQADGKDRVGGREREREADRERERIQVGRAREGSERKRTRERSGFKGN